MRFKIFSRFSKTDSQGPPALSSGSAYVNCSELPLKCWLNVNLTKDLKYLIRSGTVRTEELIVIWQNICDEFRQLVQDIDSNYKFDLQKEIAVEDCSLITITAIINQLRVRQNDELIGILKNDFNFPLNYVDLSRDLDKTAKRVKFRSIVLRQREAELKELSGDKTDKDFSEYSFIEQLDIISESRGYHLKIEDLTVLQYTAIYNRFKRDIERKLKNA